MIVDDRHDSNGFGWIAAGLSVMAGLVAGLVAGFWLWRSLRYWLGLVRQPRLMTERWAREIGSRSLLAQGVEIAAANLRSGIERRRLPDGQEKLVVCAGRRNFREPWARDLSFASFGLVELGEGQAVREALEVFLLNQLPSGQFPIKVHSTGVVDRYLHSLLWREQPITAPIRPTYRTAHGTVSLDGNALLTIAVLNYAGRMDDGAFLGAHWHGLRRSLDWLDAFVRSEDGLLHQDPFADWADSVARKGRVLYTNVVYWKALTSMAVGAMDLDHEGAAAAYQARAERLAAAINRHFWRPDLGYYVTSQEFDNLSSSGNLMAIAWDLATPQQAHAILDSMARFGMADPVPTQPVYPPYRNRYIALENRLGRVGYYHTNAAWLWLGAWHVIALGRVGRTAEAEDMLARIAGVIVRDGVVHEVYRPDGHYVSGLWYNSEAPFTWSAGMVIHAAHVVRRQSELADGS